LRDDIRVICIDLPVRCKAFTITGDGFYNIYLNSRHTYEQNVKSLKHELRHIENGDFDKVHKKVDEIEIKARECFS
jgi:hypothetical protein